MSDASTLEYDRRASERAQIELDKLEAARARLELLYAHASDDEQDRIGMALDDCGDKIGALQDWLHEVNGEIWLHGGEWR